MADTSTSRLIRTYGLTGGGIMEVTVACANGLVNFAFDYHSAHGNSALAWQESETYSGTTFGFSTELHRDVKEWVPLRVRLDQQAILERNSSSKYRNEAEIVFYDPAALKRAAANATSTLENSPRSAPGSGSPDLGGFVTAMNQVVGAMALQALPTLMPMMAAGTLADLRAGRELRVEVPLADGRSPVMVVSPQEAVLAPFLSGCDPDGGPAVAIAGTFTEPAGRTFAFADGHVSVSFQGRRSPPLPYTVQGRNIDITAPDNTVLTLRVLSPERLRMETGGSSIELTRVN